MRVAIRVPAGAPLPEVLATIEQADRAGFDTIAVPESPTLFRDCLVTLGLATARTSFATLASTVTSFVVRDPIVLASAVRTLVELAPGRIRLGIGAGDNVAFLTGRPRTTTAQLRDGVTLIRRLLAGDTVEVRGVEVTSRTPRPNRSRSTWLPTGRAISRLRPKSVTESSPGRASSSGRPPRSPPPSSGTDGSTRCTT